MIRTKKQAGFTLIELMLALAFIGILLIATIVTIVYVTNQYAKGVTLKSINQAGRDLGAAIKRDATNVASVANPLVPADTPYSGGLGRLCLGGYSYVWSTPSALADDTAPTYTGTTTPIVLARVADSGGTLCHTDAAGKYSVDVPKNDTTVEMLPNDKGDYALRSLTLTKINNPSGDEVLYDITYVIGTNQEAAISTVGGQEQCKLANQTNNNYNFCAINRFELMIRAESTI